MQKEPKTHKTYFCVTFINFFLLNFDWVLAEYQKQCMSDKKKFLVIQQYPMAVWFVGSLITIIGLYLLYHVSVGNPNSVLFHGFQEG